MNEKRGQTEPGRLGGRRPTALRREREPEGLSAERFARIALMLEGKARFVKNRGISRALNSFWRFISDCARAHEQFGVVRAVRHSHTAIRSRAGIGARSRRSRSLLA